MRGGERERGASQPALRLVRLHVGFRPTKRSAHLYNDGHDNLIDDKSEEYITDEESDDNDDDQPPV